MFTLLEKWFFYFKSDRKSFAKVEIQFFFLCLSKGTNFPGIYIYIYIFYIYIFLCIFLQFIELLLISNFYMGSFIELLLMFNFYMESSFTQNFQFSQSIFEDSSSACDRLLDKTGGKLQLPIHNKKIHVYIGSTRNRKQILNDHSIDWF